MVKSHEQLHALTQALLAEYGTAMQEYQSLERWQTQRRAVLEGELKQVPAYREIQALEDVLRRKMDATVQRTGEIFDIVYAAYCKAYQAETGDEDLPTDGYLCRVFDDFGSLIERREAIIEDGLQETCKKELKNIHDDIACVHAIVFDILKGADEHTSVA